jgi:CheY-like chemotaxis protein
LITWLSSPEIAPGAPGLRSSAPSQPGLRILIIEDNSDCADSLRCLLSLYGHYADVAGDGWTALRLASAGRYDSIVCDIGLPGMSGYDVVRQLRSERTTARTPIIAMTAYGSAEAKRQCLAAGFDAHVLKPALLTEILLVLGIRNPVLTG